MKISSLILIILSSICLAAQSGDFPVFMADLLENNPDYMKALSRYEQEKAFYTIDKSLGWFDMNFVFQQYDNDFIRNETKTVLEHSNVIEKDKRWRLELDKQLFPKDFDAAADAIGFRLDLLRFEQDLSLLKHVCQAEILDEMIEWQEARQMAALLQERLDILYQQNRILEELDLDNIIDPEILILNLEEIDDRETELYEFKQLDSFYERKYDNILSEFYDTFQIFIKQNALPDTILFEQKINWEIAHLNQAIQAVSQKIKFNYFYFFMPEMNLTLSYNWRETNQNWDITKNGVYENLLREQNEEFPEGEIEFSLPFNIFSNTSGKLALLKASERELHFRSREMHLAWQEFEVERINFYHAAQLELKRKARLKELYDRTLHIFHKKYQEEPSLLGSNPELKLKKETIQTAEAEVDHQIAEMKLYKEIFLINSFGEDAK